TTPSPVPSVINSPRAPGFATDDRSTNTRDSGLTPAPTENRHPISTNSAAGPRPPSAIATSSTATERLSSVYSTTSWPTSSNGKPSDSVPTVCSGSSTLPTAWKNQSPAAALAKTPGQPSTATWPPTLTRLPISPV